ncbi:MAG: MBL fold metallo-hydrolase [Thermodesulfobacteriota bacterium]
MKEVKVQFLGSGDAFGSGGRLQACIHVEDGLMHLLLDCGASALSAMKRLGVPPSTIDAILLTHLHGDHFGGIPFFLLEAQLVSKRQKPLVILGPPTTAERVREAMEVLFPGSTGTSLRFPLEYREYVDRLPMELDSTRVTPFPVVHASGATPYALRVECSGKVIAYSGDTEWTEGLVEAARNADLLICEAYSYDKKMKYHVDFRTLMERREELRCERVILTHMGEDVLSRLSGLDAEAAEDGKCIVL